MSNDAPKPNPKGAHLPKWKPGQSGNPNGRPKGAKGFAAFLRKQTRNGKTGAQFLIDVRNGAISRERHIVTKDGIVTVWEPPTFAESIAAEKIILDRMFGAAPKSIEVTGAGGGPLVAILENLEHASDEDLEALEAIAKRVVGEDEPAGENSGGEGEAGAAEEAAE